MLQSNGLKGRISAKESITAKLNNKEVQVYPELEDLTVTSSTEEQHFKSEKYGFDNVTVKAVESEELSIIPSAEEQTKEGLFNKVTVAGDSDLLPENIKEGTEIFGVQGTAELRGEENAIINGHSLSTNTSSSQNVYILNRMIVKLPKDIDVSNWTSTAYMFYYCQKLKELDLSSFNTSKVTNMSYMFYYCNNLTNLDLSSFNTEHVTNMQYMFGNCNSLTSLDLSSFDTSHVTDMQYMFGSCNSLTSLDLSSFDTSQTTNMYAMFYNCNSLISLDLSNFDMSKVTSTMQMFTYTSELTNLQFGVNLGKGYTQKSTNYILYKLDLSFCTKLTHESLMSVINNLYDLNLTYDVANGGTLYTQSLVLGAKNLAKLTEEEIAIATNKGWNVT